MRAAHVLRDVLARRGSDGVLAHSYVSMDPGPQDPEPQDLRPEILSPEPTA